MELSEIREKLHEMYGGENKPITDGNYDQSVAVKCINGTFVGRKTENITVFRGIPYVGKQMWTNFARCGNPSTDQIEWKAYSADDQNVLDIAGPGDIRIKKDLLADQYKAVLPLLGYYQFMDKFFTPRYLLDIVAARK